MADVSRAVRRDDRPRGQVILVTGLAIAVTLVALVLLLNTVIYTQNLATRGPAVEDGEVVAVQQEVLAGVGATVDAENRAGYDDWASVAGNVEAAVGRYDALHSRYAAGRGTVADVEENTLSLTEGTLFHQTNASRNFTDVDGTADWTAATDVGSTRDFEVTVSGENLSDGRSGAFRVEVADDAGAWKVYVYNDTDDDIAVAVDNATGSVELACTVSGPEATVDLTAGTVNGSACPKLDFATGVSAPYDVRYVSADEVTGTYRVTVNSPPSAPGVDTADFASPDAESSPRWGYAVYAAEVELHVETPDLRYHTTVRVARGEPE